MSIAEQVATRATCDRKHVGAVLVRDKNILSTGYNGSVAGLDHCDDVGHDIKDGHCVRTLHAEENAIIQAAKHGICIDNSVMFVNTYPCWNCFKKIANSGIKTVVYKDMYRPDERITNALGKISIKLIDIEQIRYDSDWK